MRLLRRWDDAPLRVKGMVVIGIPLMPLVLIAVLFMLGSRNAGTANDWMGRANRTETQIAAVLRLVVESEAGVSQFLVTHDPEALRPFRTADAELPKAVARLRALVYDSAEQLNHVRIVEALSARRPLAPIVEAAERHVELPVPGPLLSERRALTGQLRRELAAMQDLQDRLIERRSNQTRRVLVGLAVGGALFGLPFGVLAMIVFVTGVSRRIDRLREDMSRLARGETLLPLVPAKDELGELGLGIHEASRMLAAREQDVILHVQALAEANRELELSRQELDRFFSLSLDLMGIAGTDGRFKRVNPAWEQLLGWTTEELTAGPYLDFVHPDDRDATLAEASGLAEGQVTVSFENRYRAKDGSYRWLDWTAVSIVDRGLIYCAARDVTDQKTAASALQRHATELAAANEELDAFSYSVSHDLRAPLRHVTGFASLLQRSAVDRLSETEARHLRTIIDAATRMGRLIDDLLAFSRMGRTVLQRERVSLDALVDEAMHDVHGATPDLDVAWCIRRPLPIVQGDPAMLRLVLVNLLSNAVKYAGSRAVPAVEVGVAGGEAGETVVFVRDNGVGFDMQYAHKLFGVFQRLHSADDFEGTGIGLANVRRIVHRHGGRVWAEGAVGAGATFFFSLPATGVCP